MHYASSVAVVITIEEHSLIGGLGSAVAEIIAEANFDPAKKFKRIALPDVFPDEYGSQDSLLERYSINSQTLVSYAKALAEGRKLSLDAVNA